MADEFKKSDLEILVATMNRNSLDFLIPMFSFTHFSKFSILVINQTTAENLIISDYKNIRVINSYEKGLSQSRNLALKNTIGKVALIADDDVVFLPNFDSKILKAHQQNSDYSIICFQTLTNENQPYISYRKDEFWMKEKDFKDVLSIELTFKPEDLQKKNIIFNEYFGLGAKFQDAESLFFLRRANYNQLKVLFCPENIVIHKAFSSSDDVASDRLIYAKMAGFYKRYNSRAYFFLVKFVFFLIRKGYISFKEIIPKLKTGLKGIQDYKNLLKLKLENKYD